MAGLFGSGLGLGFNQGLGQSVGKSIGEGGLDEGTATSLALLNAMRQQQEAGLQRTATPIGSIAQNLIPLFGALIMGKAMAQQAAANQAGAAQEDAQNQAKLGLTQAQTDLAKTRAEAIKNQPPKTPALNEWNLRAAADQPGPEGDFARRLLAGKQSDEVAKAAAMAPGKLDQFKQELDLRQAAKKDPPPELEKSWMSGIGAVKSLDDAIAGFSTTTPADIVKSTVTGGILSNQALRDYNRFFNDIDNMRAGARGMTAAALDRIRKELPDPKQAVAEPGEFMAQLNKARQVAYDNLATGIQIEGHSYKVPLELSGMVAALGQPRKQTPDQKPLYPVSPTPQKWSFEIPKGKEEEAVKVTDRMLKAGKSEDEIGQALQNLYGGAPQ